MANPYAGLRAALMQGAVSALGSDFPLAQDNAPFDDKPSSGPWAAAFPFINQPSVATLGSEGQDAFDGILQIDLNYPLNTGEAAVTAKADGLYQYFKAGKRLAYSGVELTVTSCGRSRGREVDGWYRVSMTISWFSRVSRS